MALVYPEELPVPQTSTVTPVERRALSDPDYPRDAIALQRDRAQIEEITLPPMQADKLAIFWNWWRNDLVYGGAWFAATWPLPVGMVAAVRKFVGTPQREYVAPGYWRLSAVCEVRGAGVIPTADDAGPVVLFLDIFDGSEGTLVTDHIQDIRFNESVWINLGEYYVPGLSGTGSAGNFGDIPVFGPMGVQTNFGVFDPETFETTYPVLEPGWVLDVVITPLQSVGGDPGSQAYTEVWIDSQFAFVLIRFVPESPSESAALIFNFAGAAMAVTYPLPGGTSTLSVLVEADGATLTINGIAQDKVISETGADGLPFALSDLQLILGAETSGNEPRPYASVQMLKITGERQ